MRTLEIDAPFSVCASNDLQVGGQQTRSDCRHTSPLSSPHAKVEAALLPDSTVSLWICKHLIVIRSSGGRQIAFLFKYMTMKRERGREREREKEERERGR